MVMMYKDWKSIKYVLVKNTKEVESCLAEEVLSCFDGCGFSINGASAIIDQGATDDTMKHGKKRESADRSWRSARRKVANNERLQLGAYSVTYGERARKQNYI